MGRGRSSGSPVSGTSGLVPANTWFGFFLAVVLPVGATLLLLPFEELTLTTHALVGLCAVVVVAFFGGLWPAVLSAVLYAGLVNYFFTPPVRAFTIDDPQNFLLLLVYLGIGVVVSLVVSLAARRSRAAALSSAEAATLSELARASLADEQSSEEFLGQLREQFLLEGVSVFEQADDDGPWRLRAAAGSRAPQRPEDADVVDRPRPGLAVGLKRAGGGAAGGRLLAAYEAHLAALLERERLTLQLKESIKLNEGNRVKTSILRAVSHDLRTPLAGIELALTALRRQSSRTSDEHREEMLDVVQGSTDRLKGLVGNLLDMSRISSDSVQVLHEPVAWLDVVPEALAGVPDGVVRVDELLARLRAVERRSWPVRDAAMIKVGDLEIDLMAATVSRAGQRIRLTPREWRILRLLVENRGTLVSQQRILSEVWGPAYEKETHYLRIFVSQLRRKLEKDPANPHHLITEPGWGTASRSSRALF